MHAARNSFARGSRDSSSLRIHTTYPLCILDGQNLRRDRVGYQSPKPKVRSPHPLGMPMPSHNPAVAEGTGYVESTSRFHGLDVNASFLLFNAHGTLVFAIALLGASTRGTAREFPLMDRPRAYLAWCGVETSLQLLDSSRPLTSLGNCRQSSVIFPP
ncbi:hypothetical protein N7532_003452 [Penicillium argentinense]|uniref:Uncharacterized protein n=1 Tax=Penicillium argentinense TaxID=1131581 RepID=A0A9W9FMH9_9EURO|nr:uncharacterized protein N7532_003452 [Penicillium argentinense]KAJ5102923.1 hypothetical protein N7532_003452 [Penicillium argentinense]